MMGLNENQCGEQKTSSLHLQTGRKSRESDFQQESQLQPAHYCSLN